MKKISELSPHPHNPRKITDRRLEQLKRALLEFGDLSGIVFNVKTGHLVGGHQRVKTLNSSTDVVYVKKHPKPTKTGTVAEGYVLIDGERFSYREVSWDKTREKAAAIAANNNAGEWDELELSQWLKDLSAFDANFDLSLTMFDEKELKSLAGITVKEHTRVRGKGLPDDDEKPEKPAKCRHGQVYLLGGIRLRCHRDDLHFCDQVLAKWLRYSGTEAKLEDRPPPQPAPKASSGVSRHLPRA